MLTRRPLGQTDIHVSPLGLGTVKFGRNRGVKYPREFELPDDGQIRDLLALARELGINLLDTAPAYGESEQRLGKLLPGPRSDWVLCTKVGESFDGEQSHFDFAPEAIRASVHRSLQRLGSDYLDLVLVHSDGNDRDIIERWGALDTLAELKRAGWIRAFGMSTKTLDGGLQVAQTADAVMVTCNLRERDQQPVLDTCHRLGKGALIKKPLASGHLCETPGEPDPVQASLNHVLGQPGVSSAIIGTLNPEHLRANVERAARALQNDGARAPK